MRGRLLTRTERPSDSIANTQTEREQKHENTAPDQTDDESVPGSVYKMLKYCLSPLDSNRLPHSIVLDD